MNDFKGLIEDLRQDLLENIGEWLDSEMVVYEETLSGLPANRAVDDSLHIKMADAAILIYCEAHGIQIYSSKS